MKKLSVAIALLCLIVSASSCTVDDLDETINLNEILTQEVEDLVSEPLFIDNGDKDDTKDKRKD